MLVFNVVEIFVGIHLMSSLMIKNIGTLVTSTLENPLRSGAGK